MTSPKEPGGAKDRRGPLFWVSAAAGWALIGWGMRGALQHHVDTRPTQLARFLIGGALLHDLIFAPLVLAVGVLIARSVRGRWRAPLQAALLISGTVILFSWPEVRDYASVLHNPSSLPRNYTANLALVVGLVWAASALIAGLSWWHGRRTSTSSGSHR